MMNIGFSAPIAKDDIILTNFWGSKEVCKVHEVEPGVSFEIIRLESIRGRKTVQQDYCHAVISDDVLPIFKWWPLHKSYWYNVGEMPGNASSSKKRAPTTMYVTLNEHIDQYIQLFGTAAPGKEVTYYKSVDRTVWQRVYIDEINTSRFPIFWDYIGHVVDACESLRSTIGSKHVASLILQEQTQPNN